MLDYVFNLIKRERTVRLVLWFYSKDAQNQIRSCIQRDHDWSNNLSQTVEDWNQDERRSLWNRERDVFWYNLADDNVQERNQNQRDGERNPTNRGFREPDAMQARLQQRVNARFGNDQNQE